MQGLRHARFLYVGTEYVYAANLYSQHANYAQWLAFTAAFDGTTDQPSSTPAENAWLYNPTAVASDGTRFAVADTDNNRVLLWNTIPTGNTFPDIVLGQPDIHTLQTPQLGVVTPTIMRGPQGVWIANNRLYVADTQNNRVLIWNSWPTKNNQAPDVVLGQTNFTTGYAPPPSSYATHHHPPPLDVEPYFGYGGWRACVCVGSWVSTAF